MKMCCPGFNWSKMKYRFPQPVEQTTKVHLLSRFTGYHLARSTSHPTLEYSIVSLMLNIYSYFVFLVLLRFLLFALLYLNCYILLPTIASLFSARYLVLLTIPMTSRNMGKHKKKQDNYTFFFIFCDTHGNCPNCNCVILIGLWRRWLLLRWLPVGVVAVVEHYIVFDISASDFQCRCPPLGRSYLPGFERVARTVV